MPHPSFPAELLDHIVDNLHDEKEDLKNCCLVSKSWIPRTRRYLFATVGLRTAENLQSWKATFKDPFISPARYTKTLIVGYSCLVAIENAGDNGWIATFSRVMRLELDVGGGGPNYMSTVSLLPFHGFSPSLKSLRINSISFPSSKVFDLIHTFPLLEDFAEAAIACHQTERDGLVPAKHLNPPAFTGTLFLRFVVGNDPIAVRLLSLSGELHFRSMCLVWGHPNNVSLIRALVKKCSSTLESLEIRSHLIDDSPLGSVDLSKATKLKNVTFGARKNPRWVTDTLRTIPSRSRNLQQISFLALDTLIDVRSTNSIDPATLRHAIGETSYREWLGLDGLLALFWETRSIRPKVLYGFPPWVDGQSARRCMDSLFPEITTKGIADLVECDREYAWTRLPRA